MSGFNPCGPCNGQGGVTTTDQGSNGALISTWHPCSACNGSGLSQ